MSDPPADVRSRDETLTTQLSEHAGDGTLAIVAGAGTLFLAGRASDRSRVWAWAGAFVGAALLGYGVRKRLAFDGGRTDPDDPTEPTDDG